MGRSTGRRGRWSGRVRPDRKIGRPRLRRLISTVPTSIVSPWTAGDVRIPGPTYGSIGGESPIWSVYPRRDAVLADALGPADATLATSTASGSSLGASGSSLLGQPRLVEGRTLVDRRVGRSLDAAPRDRRSGDWNDRMSTLDPFLSRRGLFRPWLSTGAGGPRTHSRVDRRRTRRRVGHVGL